MQSGSYLTANSICIVELYIQEDLKAKLFTVQFTGRLALNICALLNFAAAGAYTASENVLQKISALYSYICETRLNAASKILHVIKYH